MNHDAQEKLAELDHLLTLEQEEVARRAEERREGKTDRQLEADGVLLRQAVIDDSRSALMGRVRLTVGEDPSRAGHLGGFAVRTGSVVFVKERDDSGRVVFGARGIVARKTPRSLEVVFDEAPVWGDRIDLVRDDDDVTLGRLKKAVAAARGLEGRAAGLVEILLGARDPSEARTGHYQPLDELLNEAQRDAAQKALFADDVALIHGPPGTGKTRVVVEVIRQLVASGQRVLALCSSNAAVDHVAIGLLACDPQIALARVGHPARVSTALEEKTLAGLTDKHERRLLARSLLDEAFKILGQARRRSDRGRDAWRREREARAEAGKLFADARRLERQAVAEVLRTTRVLCGTLTGFSSEVPEEETFDVVVVDEASQALTPSLLLGAVRAPRLVLAGDHRQLPPTVLHREALARGLGVTAFDTLMARDDKEAFSRMLVVQHRMHQDLMAFPSAQFYEGQLEAHPSVAEHLLADHELGPLAVVRPETAFELLDTAGAGHEETAPEGSDSRSNPGEAGVVEQVVRDLVDAGLAPALVGVITPYAAQSALLTEQLSDLVGQGLEVDSVDGFQGREKEAIVVSAVRSNPAAEIGFVKDPRRLNVSITRARRKLVVVGDSATLGADPLWSALVEAAVEQGAHRSVFELMDL